MHIEHSKAVISGGCSGLGLAVAKHLLAAGGKVTVLDINAEAGAAVVDELGAQANFIHCDVSDEQQVADALQQARAFSDGLNVAVSCAGILGAGRVLGREGTMPLEQFSRTITVNLIGTFNVVKAAADIMQHNSVGDDGERGVIINTASVAAYEGQIGQAAYSASKGGVVGMTLPLARELARLGIRVMTIAPGVFFTPMVDAMPEELQQALGARVPFPARLGKAEEFAGLAAEIIRNRYFNGSTVRLDGAIRLEPK